MPSGVNKVVRKCDQEEVIAKYGTGLTQLLLSLLEVKVDVQGANEVGNGIRVFVSLLANNADEIFELLLIRI